MLSVADFVKRDFQTTDAYSGVNAIRPNLARYSALVVKEEDNTIGVLTPLDIVKKSHTLVIDCLTPKLPLQIDCSLESALEKMREAQADVLPVYNESKFEGLLFKDDLVDFLKAQNTSLEKRLSNRGEEMKVITQELEQKFVEKTQELQHALMNKERVFSIIIHDIRGPFAQVYGLSNLLMMEMKNNEAISGDLSHLVSSINRVSKQTLELLDTLLEWSKIHKGTFRILFSQVNLYHVITQEIETHVSLAIAKNISIKRFMPENIIIRTDENVLRTVLRNLLNNAIKFTPRDGRITVTVMSTGTSIEVTVADTGIGMSEHDSQNLFSDFKAYSTTGTEKEKGNGLGLLICKDLVEMLGGRIWVEAQIGKGSNFKFTLPNCIETA